MQEVFSSPHESIFSIEQSVLALVRDAVCKHLSHGNLNLSLNLVVTRRAASSASIRDTLIAEDPKTRKKARMSWYHPDDTMVPRDWFKGGLLADLKYYSPFRKAQASD